MADKPTGVTFKSGNIDVAGDLRVPAGHTGDPSYAAVVIATPGSSVKAQIGANYAERLTD